jgi:hypothetical protein
MAGARTRVRTALVRLRRGVGGGRLLRRHNRPAGTVAVQTPGAGRLVSRAARSYRVTRCRRSTPFCPSSTPASAMNGGSPYLPTAPWLWPSRRPWPATRSSGHSSGFVGFALRARSKRAFRSSASRCSSRRRRRSSSGCRGHPGERKVARRASRRPSRGRSGWRWTSAPSRCPGGGSLLVTETRVAAVDEHALRAFLRYWRLVGPFSRLIRRRWLAAIARGAA